ncbi:MAG: beta-Ala-His dipeptidase [Oscillospiraceae bacterium]|nr:beta-Ala-His dipeptidase [Oscillospiraceae bacterium]
MVFDLSKRYCYYFNELAGIPHGSYNEKAVSDYIVSFAESKGLRYLQDEFNNVVIYKEPSEGYGDSAPLLIQAHMDMVCEANKGTVHDFERDPLKLYVDEDGWLNAEGTTLGADDGAGVAYMLAILEDNSLPHPPLECCFTVQEEVGLLGAVKLKSEYFRAKRMISLDGSGEVRTCISSSGGTRVNSTIPCQCEPNDEPTYDLYVGGLLGGHSGSEIHKEKGNANVLAVRIFKEMTLAGIAMNVVSINGGLKENAIPRECDIVFASPAAPERINEALDSIASAISTELEFSDPGFTAAVTETGRAENRFTADSTERVINYLYLIPNGFQHRSMAIEGLTVTSLNLGIVRTADSKVIATDSLRSAISSSTDDLLNKMRTLAGIYGVTVSINSAYPGWNYNPVSELRDKLAVVLQNELGVELICQATHGGNECGIFKSLGLEDIITYGPVSEHIHTPDERLDLESFDRSYRVLTGLIKECR